MKRPYFAVFIALFFVAVITNTANAQTPIAKLLVGNTELSSIQEPVYFQSQSLGASQLSFISGDGATVSVQPGIFTWQYANYGTYKAALVAGNSFGTDTTYVSIAITKTTPMPTFQAVSQRHE